MNDCSFLDKIFDYEFTHHEWDRKNKPTTLNVYHNLPWYIYRAECFEKVVFKLIKEKHPEMKIKDITFSEQGMQNDRDAHMDVFY